MASNNGLARRLESILDSIVMYTLSTSSKEMFVSRWILYNVANKATTNKETGNEVFCYEKIKV